MNRNWLNNHNLINQINLKLKQNISVKEITQKSLLTSTLIQTIISIELGLTLT